jgi:nucleoside-triphosphatase THEP1
VGVIGDPGLGKSRLVTEFVQDLRQRGIEVHEGALHRRRAGRTDRRAVGRALVLEHGYWE